jgi:hypothetical protein
MYSTDNTFTGVLEQKNWQARLTDRQLYPYIGQDVVITPKQLGISGLGGLGGLDLTSVLVGMVIGAALLWWAEKQGYLK